MHADCDRARQWASTELDGELSSFERVLLDAHVAGCSSCNEFRTTIGGLTGALRNAPLERFDGVIEIRRPWRRARLRLAPAAAAMAVAAVGLGSILASAQVRNSPVGPSAARASGVNSDVAAGYDTMNLRKLQVLSNQTSRVQLSPAWPRLLDGGMVASER